MRFALQPAARRGVSSLEAIVAFTLLSTVLAVSTPLIVRHSRLLTAQQDYRLALDELANQAERLQLVPDNELATALEKLAPSPFAAEHLLGVQLRGELVAIDVGQRIDLRLWWDETNRSAAPVTLSTWRLPTTAVASQEE